MHSKHDRQLNLNEIFTFHVHLTPYLTNEFLEPRVTDYWDTFSAVHFFIGVSPCVANASLHMVCHIMFVMFTIHGNKYVLAEEDDVGVVMCYIVMHLVVMC